MGVPDQPPERDRKAGQRSLPPARRRKAAPGRARNAARHHGARGRSRPARSGGAAPGAAHAGAEVLAVAERLQAPVVTYTGGKGVLSDRHYLAQNLLAGHDLWRATDVVLAVGTRFNQPQTRWGLDGEIKVIRIDL